MHWRISRGHSKIAGDDQPKNAGRRIRRRRTKYLSMFLATVDESGRKLRYVNAGHVPPAVIRVDGSCEWLTEGGMVVGLLPEQEYQCGEVALGKDDLLVALHGWNYGGYGSERH